jgi:hypothetical protein
LLLPDWTYQKGNWQRCPEVYVLGVQSRAGRGQQMDLRASRQVINI